MSESNKRSEREQMSTGTIAVTIVLVIFLCLSVAFFARLLGPDPREWGGRLRWVYNAIF
jgi:hypothetical protein